MRFMSQKTAKAGVFGNFVQRLHVPLFHLHCANICIQHENAMRNQSEKAN